MQKLFLVMYFCFNAGVYVQETSSAKSSGSGNLEWIIGNWKRVPVTPGRIQYERWTRISPEEFEGVGITIRETDTVTTEKLKIIVREGAAYYVADVPENKLPVYFKMTSVSETGFVCENPDHDFPKKIAYHNDGDRLRATISAGVKSIDYFFIRD